MANVKVTQKGKKANVKFRYGSILCVILKESKGSTWIWIKDSTERFSNDDHTYFPRSEGTYLKGGVRFLIFMEGVSTPMHHGYIERETEEREFTDNDTGKTKKVKVEKIKGLKFDSKLIDMLLNRNLADQFTSNHIDLPNLLIIVLLIVNVAFGVVNIGMWFT